MRIKCFNDINNMERAMMIARVWLVLIALAVSGFGLGFGTMGNVSAGMGGAGVALKDSAWGLYYNPALLGADRRGKIGYSFGVQIKEENLLEVATIDVDALNDLPTTLTEQLTGASSGGTSVTIGGQTVDGALGGTLEALFGKTTIDQADVTNLVSDITGSTQTCADISTCWDHITTPEAQAALKDRLAAAATEGGSPLVGSIISGVSEDKLTEVIKEVSGGNFDAATLLESVGTITLAKGADSTIDKLLEDFAVISAALDSNDVNVISQNGFVFQIAGDRKKRRVESDNLGSIDIQEVDSGRGAVAIGLFASAFSNASANLDPNNNQLIFDLNGKYYQASVDGGNVSLTHLAQQTDLSGSVMNDNANHVIYANAIALIEVPVGYGHTLFTPIGDVNVGVAVKFMQVIGYGQNLHFSVGNIPDVDFNKDDIDMSQTFGVDLGLLYTPKWLKGLNAGLVVKNLNAPTIHRSNGLDDVTLNRQIRAGVSYVMKDFLTFAFDADVLANNTLSLSSPKSQFFGGGVMANFKYVDFRLGAMKDIKSQAGEGVILTGGVNVLGFLDVALQYGLGKSITIEGFNVSNYMSLRVGGSFSF